MVEPVCWRGARTMTPVLSSARDGGARWGEGPAALWAATRTPAARLAASRLGAPPGGPPLRRLPLGWPPLRGARPGGGGAGERPAVARRRLQSPAGRPPRQLHVHRLVPVWRPGRHRHRRDSRLAHRRLRWAGRTRWRPAALSSKIVVVVENHRYRRKSSLLSSQIVVIVANVIIGRNLS